LAEILATAELVTMLVSFVSHSKSEPITKVITSKIGPIAGRVALSESLIRSPLLQVLKMETPTSRTGREVAAVGGAVLCWRFPRAVEVSHGVCRREHIRGKKGPETG